MLLILLLKMYLKLSIFLPLPFLPPWFKPPLSLTWTITITYSLVSSYTCVPIKSSLNTEARVILLFFFIFYFILFYFIFFICSEFCHTLEWNIKGGSCHSSPQNPLLLCNTITLRVKVKTLTMVCKVSELHSHLFDSSPPVFHFFY